MGVPRPPLAQRPAAAVLPDEPAFRALVRARNPAALGRVFDVYWKPLYERAQLILPPRLDPENVAGEVMFRLVERAHTLDPARPLYPWLAHVCANLCLNRWRRDRPTSWWARVFRGEAAPPLVSGMERREARDALHAALAVLTEERREAILLRHLFVLEEDEIAQLGGVKPGQVRRLLLEGLRAVRHGEHGNGLDGFWGMEDKP
jgi:RNA polymerase sigma factor (sigma-70 family)